MLKRNQFIKEISPIIAAEDDLTDDSTWIIPMFGLKTQETLRDRFVKRLSKTTKASVRIHESHYEKKMEIYLSRNKSLDQVKQKEDAELTQFVKSLESSLSTIAKPESHCALKNAKDDLWDAILLYSYTSMYHITESLQSSFANHQFVIDELVTKMFGINDEAHGSQMDRELGDVLIFLFHAVQSYDTSMKQFHLLVKHASNITKEILHLHSRLKYLLMKATFANELYSLIVTLGFPERAYSTFVRAAASWKEFSRVSFHFQTRPSSSRSRKDSGFGDSTANIRTKPITSPAPGSTIYIAPSPVSLKSRRPVSQQPHKTPVTTASSAALPSTWPASPDDDISAVIGPFLSEEDRTLGPFQLHPASKRDTAQLVGAVLRGKLLPTSTNAWYTFGFVTTRNESEECILGGIYAAILRESSNPQAIFLDLTRAVESTTLLGLITSKEYAHILTQLPRSLTKFLTTPASQRSTIWLLKQFIADDADTPPIPPLQRDYGFKFCRHHHEVQRLKNIYSNLLKAIHPMELHGACVHGRLYEIASAKGHAVPSDRRLMQNDFPAPCVGIDNGKGLGPYMGPFFKRG